MRIKKAYPFVLKGISQSYFFKKNCFTRTKKRRMRVNWQSLIIQNDHLHLSVKMFTILYYCLYLTIA